MVIEGTTPVWAQTLCDGSYYVALFNLNDSSSPVTVSWTSLGFSGPASVRDLWARNEVGSVSGGYSVSLNAHGSALLRVSPESGGRGRDNRGRCEVPGR